MILVDCGRKSRVSRPDPLLPCAFASKSCSKQSPPLIFKVIKEWTGCSSKKDNAEIMETALLQDPDCDALAKQAVLFQPHMA